MIIDTHQHLWDPGRFSYPGLESAPAIFRPFLSADYLAASKGSGIGATVFVEGAAGRDSIVAEADWVLALADDEQNRIAGVVASAWPEDDNFSERIETLAANPKVKGIRRVLHTAPDGTSQEARFRENLRKLGPTGLSFDLCVLERQLPLAVDLVDACPEVAFMLDHCGVPDIASRQPDFWRRNLADLARRPNVHCKISGLMLYTAPDQRTVDGLLPWFAFAVETFGWERVVWGGDWPVCTLAGSLTDWVTLTHGLLDAMGAGAPERQRLLELNARQFYRLS